MTSNSPSLGKRCGKGDSIVESCNKGKTGDGVIQAGNGVFNACTRRTSICDYECCNFGEIGNFIASLPQEVEEARKLGLKFDHLQVEKRHDDGSCTIACSRPCVKGDFKPIDCMIYPLFPMNEACTRFIVADHRKCPIPDIELLEHALWVQRICRERESIHSGTIRSMMHNGLDFKGYQPFPYEVHGRNENGKDIDRRPLNQDEIEEITPHETMSDDYLVNWPIAKAIREYYRGDKNSDDSSLWNTVHSLNAQAVQIIRAETGEGETMLDWLNRYMANATPEDRHPHGPATDREDDSHSWQLKGAGRRDLGGGIGS